MDNYSSDISKIIEKYVNLILEAYKSNNISKERMQFESYTTETSIVDSDFYEKGSICFDNNIKMADFGSPIVLFNDLKNSTKTIEFFESLGLECAYSLYIFYSSKLLSEILNLFKGKMIECTGDGNYSIFMENEIKIDNLRKQGLSFIRDDLKFFVKDSEVKIYNSEFNEKEEPSISAFFGLFLNEFTPEFIRCLIFYIFMAFNIPINNYFNKKINNPFLTRVGCLKGACKITKIKIDKHISQDKLIGSVVHKAAHQASGK